MSIINRFTADEIEDALKHPDNTIAAHQLTSLGRATVSRQLVRHWRNKHKRPTAPKPIVDHGPKVSIIDIETAPVLGYVWGQWQQNLGLPQIVDEWYILSYAHKWAGEDEVEYRDQRHQFDIEKDQGLLQRLWEILDEADIIVAHNGRKFDAKRIRTRLIMAGFPPPSPFKVYDTLEAARRHFNFLSNKLEYLTDKLCATKKLKHDKYPGFELWKQCLLGNQEAWADMEAYNRVDVLSLEELYYLMLPWDDKHPNAAIFTEQEEVLCPRCLSPHMELVAKPYRTNVGLYDLYRCGGCNGWAKGRKLKNSIDQRRTLLGAV